MKYLKSNGTPKSILKIKNDKSLGLEKLNDLIAISGESSEKCSQALKAANGDANLAFEFLQSGMPSHQSRS